MRRAILALLVVVILCMASCAESPTPVEIEKPTVVVTASLTEPEPEPEPEPVRSLWTDEEIDVLAMMVWGEARGVVSVTQQAACVWCVLNRCDAYGQSIVEIVTAPNQFAGYCPENPVDDGLKALCEDVLTRYFLEKDGNTDVGRVLPPDYLFFTGDGERNHFRNKYTDGQIWDWDLPTPYES